MRRVTERRRLAQHFGPRADEESDVDADREGCDRHLAVKDADAAVLEDAAEHAVLQVIDEVGDVDLRLQADEVVGGEAAGKLAVLGDREERLRRAAPGCAGKSRWGSRRRACAARAASGIMW